MTAFRNVVDLAAVVRKALGSFETDELAYLALTGRPDLSLRDRIAFKLHTSPSTEAAQWTVSRDYRRVDLAVLRHDLSAAAVIELKSIFAHEALLPSKLPALRATLHAEIDKCLAASSEKCDSYLIVGLTHALARIPTHLFRTVKAAAEINRKLVDGADVTAQAGTAGRVVSEVIKERGARVLEIPARAGSAFGIPVEIYWFVVEATKATA